MTALTLVLAVAYTFTIPFLGFESIVLDGLIWCGLFALGCLAYPIELTADGDD